MCINAKIKSPCSILLSYNRLYLWLCKTHNTNTIYTNDTLRECVVGYYRGLRASPTATSSSELVAELLEGGDRGSCLMVEAEREGKFSTRGEMWGAEVELGTFHKNTSSIDFI